MPYLPSTPTGDKPRSTSPTESTAAAALQLSAAGQCSLVEPTSPTKVQSSAVVRYSESGVPVPLARIAQNTDLRLVALDIFFVVLIGEVNEEDYKGGRE